MLNQTSRSHSGPALWLVLLAFATVYLVWGSTYLAIRLAIDTLPPFFMAGVRFLTAGSILYLWMRRVRASGKPTLTQWKSAAGVGCLMLIGGNGLVCWAEQHVPSGWTALVIGTVPLWLVMLDWLLHRGPRPTGRIMGGLVAGLVGVGILAGPGELGGERIHLGGGLALLLACFFWALGSLRSRQADLPASPFVAAAMEMTAAGAALIVLSMLLGEGSRLDAAAVSPTSVLAVGYLVFFGSILAFTAYCWLLKVTTSARVSTYAYVNPVVAMFLGYAALDEPLTPRVLAAAAIILGAVVLITFSPRVAPGAASSQPASTAPYARGNETAEVPCVGPTAVPGSVMPEALPEKTA